jgi:hypothetical protein
MGVSDPSKAAAGRGDFYVEEVCCTACGVPQAIAPELVGWREDASLMSCYWIRQPETAEEVDKAIKIIHTQELGCHRYRGKDPAILARLPREECDFYHPENAFRYRREFGPSEVPIRFSLSASREADVIFGRIWRRVTRRGSGK